MNWPDKEEREGPELNPVPVNFASAKDVPLDALAHLKQLEPITDPEFLGLHVAQLTATVADQQEQIFLLWKSVLLLTQTVEGLYVGRNNRNGNSGSG